MRTRCVFTLRLQSCWKTQSNSTSGSDWSVCRWTWGDLGRVERWITNTHWFFFFSFLLPSLWVMASLTFLSQLPTRSHFLRLPLRVFPETFIPMSLQARGEDQRIEAWSHHHMWIVAAIQTGFDISSRTVLLAVALSLFGEGFNGHTTQINGFDEWGKTHQHVEEWDR